MNNVVILQQRVLARWRGQIDGNDAIIVSHIDRMQQSHNPKIAKYRIDGGYCWVDLNALLEDNPSVRIDYSGLRKRLANLLKIGILERESYFERGRRRSYFRLSAEWHKWISWWEAHDGEEAARVYGWPKGKQGPHRDAVSDTGSPQGLSEGPHRDAVQGPYRDHNSQVSTKGKPVGSDGKPSSHNYGTDSSPTATDSPAGKEKRKKHGAAREMIEHPTLGVPIGATQYAKLCAKHGQQTVDQAIERAINYLASTGKRPTYYKDFAATAANYIAGDIKKRGRDDAIFSQI